MARQFASQRTAFAIAGSGPVQSDGFPILEYEAPLAFYIGATATKIERFDERTWQSAFASKEKRNTLMNLSDDLLRAAFTNASFNLELGNVVKQRLQRQRGDAAAAATGFGPVVPCLFQVSSVPVEEQFPPNANEEMKQLYRSATLLEREGADWAEQIQTLRRILLSQLSPGSTNSIGKMGAHFGGIAARACIVHIQLDLAREMLELGFKFFPGEPELAYLARLLEREAAAQAVIGKR